MGEKICVLNKDPEEFKPGVWSLNYDSFYTSIDEVRCGEIKSLKKGDKIVVTKMGHRVMHVKRYVDPLGGLDILEENVK